jgi:hypothetical protein
VRRGAAALATALAAVAFGLGGCGTCRTSEPPVRPSVGGAIGGGSGGFYHSMGVGFDVTNLFCRQPEPGAQQQQPTPGTPPLGSAPAESQPSGSQPDASPPR